MDRVSQLSITENSSFSGIFHTSFTTSPIAFKAFENSSKLFFRSLFSNLFRAAIWKKDLYFSGYQSVI
jgi:hypothetical protein